MQDTAEPTPQSQELVARAKEDFSARTDVGIKRKLNEDSYFAGVADMNSQIFLAKEQKTKGWRVSSSLIKMAENIFKSGVRGLFIVADGAGGHAAGEVASQEAIRFAVSELAQTQGWDKLNPDQILAAISKAVDKTNNWVYKIGTKLKTELVTTFTMALVVRDELYLAHLGDSRCYRYQSETDRLEQLTKDHSLVQGLIDYGNIRAEERYDHTHRNVLTQSLGNSLNIKPDLRGPIPFKGKIRLLLCSDGLWEMLRGDIRIKKILAKNKASHELTEELIEAANLAGGSDNITAIVADLEPIKSSNLGS